MLFAADVPVPSGDNMVTLGTLGTLIAGVVAWILKSALPSIIAKMSEFLDKQNATAKEEREAASAERKALLLSHHEQMSKREETCSKLAATVVDLTHVVSDLAAEVKAMRVMIGEPHQPQPVSHQIAPEPRAKQRGQ